MTKPYNLMQTDQITAEWLEDIKEPTHHSFPFFKVCTLFLQPSTRTRLSFEAASLDLNMKVLSVPSAETSSLSKGESLQDTIRTVGEFADVIVLRYGGTVDTPALTDEEVRSLTDAHVISAGSATEEHPTQAIIDAHVIKQEFGRLDNLKIGLIGDLGASRTAKSLVRLLANMGRNHFYGIAPYMLQFSEDFCLDIANRDTHSRMELSWAERNHDFLKMLDVLYVVGYHGAFRDKGWLAEGHYEEMLRPYKLTEESLQALNTSAIIMHPLPRNTEAFVDDDPRCRIWQQVHYAVRIRRSVLHNMLKES